jgi:PTS system nitrogen regulatory IIA component
MNLTDFLKEENTYLSTYYENFNSFYSEFATFLKDRGIIRNSQKVKRLFVKRENVQSTVLKNGIAAPHIYSDEFSEFTFYVAFIKNGIQYGPSEDKKAHLIFLIMSDKRDVSLHLKALAQIAKIINQTNIHEEIMNASDKSDVYRIITKHYHNIL